MRFRPTKMAVCAIMAAVLALSAGAFATTAGANATQTSKQSPNLPGGTTSGVNGNSKLPTLFVLCLAKTCNTSSLNLAAIERKYHNQVNIVPINAATDPVELVGVMLYIELSAYEQALVNYSAQYLKAHHLPVTYAEMKVLWKQKSFVLQAVQHLSYPSALTGPANPKFFLLSARTGELLASADSNSLAGSGRNVTEAEVVSFISNGLKTRTLMESLGIPPLSGSSKAGSNINFSGTTTTTSTNQK